MLNGISPLFSPELLAAIYRMGHGDEIVLADAHYPGESMNSYTIRADGLQIPDLLDAILPLFPLDAYVDHPIIMMDAAGSDSLDPATETAYRNVIDKYSSSYKIKRLDRFKFYDRSKTAFAVIMTGDTRQYANIILKKGVCK